MFTFKRITENFVFADLPMNPNISSIIIDNITRAATDERRVFWTNYWMYEVQRMLLSAVCSNFCVWPVRRLLVMTAFWSVCPFATSHYWKSSIFTLLMMWIMEDPCPFVTIRNSCVAIKSGTRAEFKLKVHGSQWFILCCTYPDYVWLLYWSCGSMESM